MGNKTWIKMFNSTKTVKKLSRKIGNFWLYVNLVPLWIDAINSFTTWGDNRRSMEFKYNWFSIFVGWIKKVMFFFLNNYVKL